MSHVVMGCQIIYKRIVIRLCYTTTLNISRLMVHAQHVEDARAKRKSSDAKRARSFNDGSSRNRLEIQDKPRFKKWVSNNVTSKFSKARDDRVSNHKP